MTKSFPAPFFRKTATGAINIESKISTSLLFMTTGSFLLLIPDCAIRPV